MFREILYAPLVARPGSSAQDLHPCAGLAGLGWAGGYQVRGADWFVSRLS